MAMILEEIIGNKLGWTQTDAHSSINKHSISRELVFGIRKFSFSVKHQLRERWCNTQTLATINIDFQIMHKINV
jgi:hypothetical protein